MVELGKDGLQIVIVNAYGAFGIYICFQLEAHRKESLESVIWNERIRREVICGLGRCVLV